METLVKINKAPSGIHWTSLSNPICDYCGWLMKYHCHGNKRGLNNLGIFIWVVQAYYICSNPDCNHKEKHIAKHPEIIPRRLYSKSTFAQVIYLRYIKKYTIKQILEEMPYLNRSACYQMISSYRAARRAGADKRIAKKFPQVLKSAYPLMEWNLKKGNLVFILFEKPPQVNYLLLRF